MEARVADSSLRVLFVSRRNTIRSLMAEAIMNQKGRGKFLASSAGVEPAAEVDPLTISALRQAGYDPKGLRPKLVIEVIGPGAPPHDFLFTLSDTARSEPLPEVPGQPVSAHWHCDDPVLIRDDDVGAPLIHGRVLALLERRIGLFMELPFERLGRASLQQAVEEIAAPAHGGS
jgi:protein-tyrosine-phosphatase